MIYVAAMMRAKVRLVATSKAQSVGRSLQPPLTSTAIRLHRRDLTFLNLIEKQTM